MPVTVKIKEEPPRELIRVIEEYYGTIETIKEVLIDINVEALSKEAIAAFNPKTGQVVLDLNKCLDAKKWVDNGLMRIQAIWFNMLRAIYHEGTHAEQLRDYPKLVEEQELAPNYEEEAETEALFQICGWAERCVIIPKLDDMGWCGPQIKSMVNRFYGQEKIRPFLMQELAALEFNGCAEISIFSAYNDDSISETGYKALCEAIDNKDIGMKVQGARYLDPLGFFGFFLDKIDVKDRAKTAQDRADEE